MTAFIEILVANNILPSFSVIFFGWN